MDTEATTIIIGAGQAGLATAHALMQRGQRCLVLDGGDRIGDGWRHHYDSLRLYTPAKYSGLPGLPFPGDPWHFPGKDEVAAYLEQYALHFDLPVRMSTRVDRLEARPEGGYSATIGADTAPPTLAMDAVEKKKSGARISHATMSSTVA